MAKLCFSVDKASFYSLGVYVCLDWGRLMMELCFSFVDFDNFCSYKEFLCWFCGL